MDFNPKCINKLFNNIKSISKFERRIKSIRVKTKSINSLKHNKIHCKLLTCQQNIQKTKSFKVLEMFVTEKIELNIC